MIKAGSLYYAIMICVLVGICCASFLLISHYSKMHSVILQMQTELLSTNDSATNYFLSRVDGAGSAIEKIDLFENGIVSEGKVSNWGFYKILATSSVFKTDTVRQQALIGQKSKGRIALYLTDNDKPLQMVGKAKIIGLAYVPKNGIKKGYIASQSFSNFKFLEGKKYTSGNKLPSAEGVFKFPDIQMDRPKLMEEIKDREVLYNSFDKETLEILVSETSFNHKILKGNIVIRSTDSLYIKKENVLEDVLIMAPDVVFEKGFNGTVQVKADEEVELEEKTVLKYPSGIFMDSGKAEKVRVTLKESSKFLGSIVVTGNSPLQKGTSLISVQKDAQIVGTVYCNGSTELKGKVMGSLFTNNFYLKTQASTYENYIEDGVIDQRSFPDFFLGNSFERANSKNVYRVIKTL